MQQISHRSSGRQPSGPGQYKGFARPRGGWLASLLSLILSLAVSVSGLHAPQLARAAPSDLPVLGDPTGIYLTPEQEYRLGRAWLRDLRGQVPILDDPLVQDYVESLVYRLASFSDLSAPDLAVVVVNSREINAFAVPGGVIGLNTGLFLHAESEDEVASVIAHEIAHVSQRHFTRRYADNKRISSAMLVGILASLALAIGGSTEAGMAGIMSSQAAAIQAQLSYSRHQEREADRVGMQTLVNAGMDPMAMSHFFERLLRQYQFQGTPPEFLLSHPLTEDRVADARARANTLPRPSLHRSESFALIRARIQAGFMRDLNEAERVFRRQADNSQGLDRNAARFGLSTVLYRQKRYDEAAQLLQELMVRSPDQYWYPIALAEVELRQNRPQAAIDRLQDILRIMPGHYPTTAVLAQALIDAGELDQARRLLERQLLRRQDLVLWQLLSTAATRSDNRALVHWARAETLFGTGRNAQALEQMRYALREVGAQFELNAKLRARLTDMERLANETF